MKFNVVTDLSKSFNPYPKSPNKNVKKESKSGAKNMIKKKSSKQAKLERERDKDLIKKGKCEFCGKYSDKLDPHEVYGGSNRKRSIKNKFVALLCRNCHDNQKVIEELRKKYQREYEKEHTREDFIKLIGKSYLKL